jgi:aerobic-type carbon monoxide dehydrogenase small subunit (CoxS/CutS family)
VELALIVDGERHTVSVDPLATLLRVLRDVFGLTGSKGACGRGECGACTVLVGGRAVMSCITFAARVHDEVVTIEGLAPRIEALREAFADRGGFQCGFCTPGQLVRCAALIAEADGPPDEAEVRRQLSGNICRCTGYDAIVDAVLEVARGGGLPATDGRGAAYRPEGRAGSPP